MSTTLDDAMVTAAIGDLDQAEADAADPESARAAGRAVLPEATIAALRLANLLTSESPAVDGRFYEMLRNHFSDSQVLELGSALAVASGWQTFIEAFGIRPDGQWLEGVR